MDGKARPGVGFAQAPTFVGKQLAIDPVRRLTPGAIIDDVKGLEQGG